MKAILNNSKTLANYTLKNKGVKQSIRNDKREVRKEKREGRKGEWWFGEMETEILRDGVRILERGGRKMLREKERRNRG